jgi:DoxX-like family
MSRTSPFAGLLHCYLFNLHQMKRDTIIYWTTTGVICAVMVFSAINFSLSHPLAPGGESFGHLGYPYYFKTELTTAKILGVLALLIPSIPATLKEFAYFGFAIVLISASIAHFSIGDGMMFVVDPLIFFCVLIVSYAYFRNRYRLRSRLKA